MADVVYRSRVDAWLVAAVALAPGFLLVDAISAYPESPRETLSGLAMLALLAALGAIFGYPCTYTLASTHLLIRSGAFRQRIAYADVTSVEPSRSAWAAPALSLRRVRIVHAGRVQLVSPREREAFIEALRERVQDARSATGQR